MFLDVFETTYLNHRLIAATSIGALYKSNTRLSLLQVAEGWVGEFKISNSKFQISNFEFLLSLRA